MHKPKAPERAGWWLSLASAFALTGPAAVLAADPAAAPTNPDEKKTEETKTEEKKEETLETVIVTGSHIRKDEYSSASPIQIISHDESVLAGLASTTEALQGSTVTGGGNQINNYFGGYVTDGGPGANTLSLRGLGAVRTLILLNGRRLAPAGTRGSVGSADLNVLPSAMVDRIEILKDGASSVYGSDAVAGVVNIITKSGINDFTAEANRINTFDGGGNTTTFSLVGGHSWDKGQLNGSLEVYDRTQLAVGQRDWASCSTASDVNPSLVHADGTPICFPVSALTGTNGIAHNYIVSPQYSADGTYLGARWTPDSSVTSPLAGWRNVDAANQRSGYDKDELNDSLISPTRNYTAFLNGSYDLGVLGNAEAYFEALYTRRESKQIGTRQLDLDYQLGSDFSNNPLVPEEIYNSGGGLAYNPNGDLIIARALAIWGNDTSSQTVNFTRVVGGLRGNLPFGDWQYDANLTANRSDASYTFQSFLTDRIYDSLYLTQVDSSFSGPTRVGTDGLTYTCSVNVTTPGTGCVPAPVLNSDLLSGNIDQAYRNYVWQNVTGHTNYDEVTFSGIANGALAELPYGKLSAAAGVEYRTMKLNDTPSQDSINHNLYLLTSSGITKGKDAVREIFGEVEAPLLRGLPFAEDLTANISARYTDYNSYGADRTYKLGLNYTPVKWFKLRGTKGTSYRAPALFEQYLSPTSGFLSGSVDPCYDYGSLPTTSNIYKNCAAEGLSTSWLAASGVEVDSAGGASTGLKSEHSHADTLGLVIQPTLPARAGDFSFAADWWRIKVGDQVAQIGASNILSLCYESAAFRSGGSYCTLATRDANGNLVVRDNYINIATQIAEGVDYNARYTREIGVGEFTADLRATRYLGQKSNLLPTDPLIDYNGQVLYPKWVGDMDLKYKWKDWTFYYSLTYVGNMNSNAYLGVDPATDGYNYAVGYYTYGSASVKYTSPSKWSLIVGVRNLNNEVPKAVTAGYYDRVGNSLLYSGYDYFGRRIYMTLSKTF